MSIEKFQARKGLWARCDTRDETETKDRSLSSLGLYIYICVTLSGCGPSFSLSLSCVHPRFKTSNTTGLAHSTVSLAGGGSLNHSSCCTAHTIYTNIHTHFATTERDKVPRFFFHLFIYLFFSFFFSKGVNIINEIIYRNYFRTSDSVRNIISNIISYFKIFMHVKSRVHRNFQGNSICPGAEYSTTIKW